ncbi:MAG: sodium/solute symporter [Candidatus Hydrogenedentes bacterium]|nr:sodium/solute symporter [Candidatus Hydrogenedentota bacterium]
MAPTQFTTLDWVILILYFGSMAMMGPLFARRGRSTEGYFLGNRSFPGWLIGLSMFATSISSITFVAYPADAYKTAYIRFLPCIMLPFGIYFASLFFLPYFRKAKAVSAFEYLEARFGSGTRLYASSMFVVGQVIRLSLILYLVALLVHEMTGIDPYWCILIGGVVTSFYTITGGIEAVIWTDFIQSFLLWAGGFICLFVIIYKIDGGFARILSEAWNDGKFMLGDLNQATGKLEKAPWGFSLIDKTVVMMLLIGLNNWLTEYSSNQNVIQKYCASKNPKEATRAIWICCVCSVPTWGFFMLLGTALYVFFKLHPDPAAAEMLTGVRKTEQVLPFFVVKYLPAGLSGLVIAGVLAAAMSSLSSSINAISAVSIVDIYKRRLVRGRPDRHYVMAAKLISLAASFVMLAGAFLLMKANDKTLQDTATKLGALTGGGLLGLYVLGFLTTRGDGRAVLAGILTALAFSLYITASELKWITPDTFAALGFGDALAARIAKPIDTYYAGMLANLFMFLIGYAAACIISRPRRDLTNLTAWTQDRKAEE